MFFGMFLVLGTRQSFGVFVDTWEREWGVTTGDISIAAAIGWIVNGFSQPILGRIVDRFGGKVVVVISSVVLGVSYLLMAFIDGVLMLAALFGFVVSFFSGGISPGTSGAVITRWFHRKRGMAMSIVAAGGSLGGLVMVPFLAQLMLATTWQTTWIVSGVIVLALGVPVSVLILRNSPDDVGQLPDGEVRSTDSQASAAQHSRVQALMRGGPLGSERWTESFKSWPMWQLSIGYFVCGITTASISTHFVRWAISEDISQSDAAWAFGILMGINAGGVVLIGLMSDYIQRHYLLALVYLVRGVAFVSLIVLPGATAMWAFALIGGASWLATVPLTTGLTADVYGVRNVGMLGGLINFSHQMGGGAAVLLFGLTFDRLGTYDPAFAGGAICLLIAGIVIFTIQEKKYSIRYAPARGVAV
jgi:sugar phosphate permease